MHARFLIVVLSVMSAAGSSLAAGKKNKFQLVILPPSSRKATATKVSIENFVTIVEKELNSLGMFEVKRASNAKIEQLLEKDFPLSDCLTDVVCVRSLAKGLAARVLLRLQAESTVGGTTFTVQTFDGETGRSIHRVTDFASNVPLDQQRALRWLTRMACGPVLGWMGKEKAHLEIAAAPAGTELFLNGTRHVVSGTKTFELDAGAYDLVVRAKGSQTFHDVIALVPGQVKQLGLKLAREEKKKPGLGKGDTTPPPPPEPKFYQKWWFWAIVGGVAAGAAATGLYFGLASGPAGQGQVTATWR